MPDSTAVYCFVDTNTLLQFTAFDEIDWPSAIEAQSVILVLSPAVLKEIDKKKLESRTRERAKIIERKLKGLRKQRDPITRLAPVRQDVSLLMVEEPRIDWEHEGLDPSIPDDRIIGSMLDFRFKVPEASIALVSNDFNPSERADARGFAIHDPADFAKELPVLSELERENKKLKEEVERFRNRQPNLQLYFASASERALKKLIVPRPNPTQRWATDEEIEQAVESERSECLNLLTDEHWNAIPDECEDYEQQVDDYARSLRGYHQLRRTHLAGWDFSFELMLHNQGNGPATNIEALLFWPKDASVEMQREALARKRRQVQGTQPERPAVPRIPTLEERLAAAAQFHIPDYALNPYLMDIPPVPLHQQVPYSPPSTINASGYFVEIKLAELRAKDPWHSVAVMVIMPPQTAGGLTIDTQVHCNEMLEPRTGTLHVVFSK